MQRVLVIGPCGAGKSTASFRLAELLGLPLYHLDQLHWRAGWIESSSAELEAALEPILARESWLIDGNYGGTLARRIERADTVVYLDYPVGRCLWRALKRVALFRGQVRPDMAPGCPERFDLEFLLYILNWNRGPRQRTEATLAGHEAKIKRFRSHRDLQHWMDSVTRSAPERRA